MSSLITVAQKGVITNFLRDPGSPAISLPGEHLLGAALSGITLGAQLLGNKAFLRQIAFKKTDVIVSQLDASYFGHIATPTHIANGGGGSNLLLWAAGIEAIIFAGVVVLRIHGGTDTKPFKKGRPGLGGGGGGNSGGGDPGGDDGAWSEANGGSDGSETGYGGVGGDPDDEPGPPGGGGGSGDDDIFGLGGRHWLHYLMLLASWGMTAKNLLKMYRRRLEEAQAAASESSAPVAPTLRPVPPKPPVKPVSGRDLATQHALALKTGAAPTFHADVEQPRAVKGWKDWNWNYVVWPGIVAGWIVVILSFSREASRVDRERAERGIDAAVHEEGEDDEEEEVDDDEEVDGEVDEEADEADDEVDEEVGDNDEVADEVNEVDDDNDEVWEDAEEVEEFQVDIEVEIIAAVQDEGPPVQDILVAEHEARDRAEDLLELLQPELLDDAANEQHDLDPIIFASRTRSGASPPSSPRSRCSPLAARERRDTAEDVLEGAADVLVIDVNDNEVREEEEDPG